MLLAGFVFACGLIAGVELHAFSLGYACPQSVCVDSAKVKVVTNSDYFIELHKALSEAKSSIHIVAFELKYYKSFPTSLQNQIVTDLIDAKKRGVEVKALVDEYSTDNNAFDILRENGVEVKLDSENVTTHAKLVIIDGKIVLVGSTNLSFYALEKNNEANALIEDEKTAQEFEDYFQKLWKSF